MISAKTEPKYVKVAHQLREQMRSRQLRPGDRLPSYPEMKARGIGQDTMERAHAHLQREGLIERNNGRGVFVAEPLTVQNSTGVIGFACDAAGEVPSSLYWAHLAAGLQAGAQKSQRQVLLIKTVDVEDGSVWGKIDGLVLAGHGAKLQDIVRALPPHVPAVTLLEEMPGLDCVRSDERGGFYLATQHLLALGHRRIGCLVSEPSEVSTARVSGYEAALQEAGIEPGLRWVRGFSNRDDKSDSVSIFMDSGRRVMREWWENGWRETGLTALLCQNDHVAVGAIQTLQGLGADVPGEISVVGVDGTEMYDFFSPRLTTVQVPLRAIGERAVDWLTAKIDGQSEDEPRVETLPVTLRIGESTGPAPL